MICDTKHIMQGLITEILSPNYLFLNTLVRFLHTQDNASYVHEIKFNFQLFRFATLSHCKEYISCNASYLRDDKKYVSCDASYLCDDKKHVSCDASYHHENKNIKNIMYNKFKTLKNYDKNFRFTF
jgi:hypothetical protein